MKILEDMSGNKIYSVESTKDWENVPEDVIYLNIGKNFSLPKDFFNKSFPLLKSITVEDGNVKLSSSDGVLYDYYKNKIYLYPPQKKDKVFVVPEGVKDICRNCFRENYYLAQVTLPKSLSYVGYYAFNGVNLLRVNISDLSSFCQINFSTSLFNKNTLLYVDGKKVNDQLVIEDVNYIKPHTFENLQLNDVILRNIHIIGIEAFYNCDLTVVQLNSSEKVAIENFAFVGNDNLSFLSKVNSLRIGEKTFKELNYLEAKVNSIVFVPETFKSELRIKKFGVLKNSNAEVYVLPECTPELILEIYKEEVK